jgi:flagellar motor switch protein FliN/FliY
MNATLMESIEYSNATNPDYDEGEVVVKRDLAMLGHVAVRLEVVLGRTSTTVDELFALKAGSSLKLDTELEAAVALQLNGKTIAKGHLVAIDDHFGIKIIEIA